MPIPIDNLPIGLGFYPVGEKQEAEFFMSISALDKIEREGPTWKFDSASHVLEVIKKPDAVFQDLKRKEFENGLCYSYCPPQGTELKAYEGKVFLAFIYFNFGLVVFDWAWREGDGVGRPSNWQDDLGSLIWSRT